MAVNDWKELTDLTGGERIVVERVRLRDSGIAIEGQFEPPDLARLPAEDQVFVMTFVQVHGSIKEMERLFGSATRRSRTVSIGSRGSWRWWRSYPRNRDRPSLQRRVPGRLTCWTGWSRAISMSRRR